MDIKHKGFRGRKTAVVFENSGESAYVRSLIEGVLSPRQGRKFKKAVELAWQWDTYSGEENGSPIEVTLRRKQAEKVAKGIPAIIRRVDASGDLEPADRLLLVDLQAGLSAGE